MLHVIFQKKWLLGPENFQKRSFLCENGCGMPHRGILLPRTWYYVVGTRFKTKRGLLGQVSQSRHLRPCEHCVQGPRAQKWGLGVNFWTQKSKNRSKMALARGISRSTIREFGLKKVVLFCYRGPFSGPKRGPKRVLDRFFTFPRGGAGVW